MKIHPFNISLDGYRWWRESTEGRRGEKKKNCRGTRNDESCRGGKWNAAALYSIVSSKFVSDKKKKSYFAELVEKAKTKRKIKKGKEEKKERKVKK